MNLLIDSFWRALAYCMHPRVVLLSLLPLLLMVCITSALGYFFWEPALDAIRDALGSSDLVHSAWTLLENWGLGSLKSVLPLLIVLVVVTPFVVILSMLMVALLMTPAIVQLIARRRFPTLERLGNASLLRSLVWSLGSSLLALVATVLTLPLWLIPPLFMVLPPLIWGWLNFRVMSFDALADHATEEERRTLLRQHGTVLLGMGVVTGFLGAAPSLIWSFGMATIVMAPFLIPLSIWIYTLVFAFSSLWYSHFCLAALRKQRSTSAPNEVLTVDVTVVESS
jgi:hypothetical protein